MLLDDQDAEGDALLADDGALEVRFFPRFGARWDSAEAAAVFDFELVRPSRRTLDAAFAALALVRRCFAMRSTSDGIWADSIAWVRAGPYVCLLVMRGSGSRAWRDAALRRI